VQVSENKVFRKIFWLKKVEGCGKCTIKLNGGFTDLYRAPSIVIRTVKFRMGSVCVAEVRTKKCVCNFDEGPFRKTSSRKTEKET
jgi:hypothetical protein